MRCPVESFLMSVSPLQVSAGGDEEAGAAPVCPSGRQRGDGSLPAHHGRQAKETHSDKEGKGSGLEGAEREGENPQTAGWMKKREPWTDRVSVESREPEFLNKQV